jgi:predicted permease
MREEIETHVAMRTEYLMAHGLSRAAAEQESRDRFGDFDAAGKTLCESAKQREGRMRRREWVGIIRQDVVFALRQARREIGLTVVIVATLGLGLGANVVMFGVVDRLLLQAPSHTPRADRVVRPWFERTTKRFGTNAAHSTNWPGYQDLAAAKSFSSVGAYDYARVRAVGRGADASSLTVVAATSSLFTVLGARPAMGRFYSADEDRPPRGSPVAVVSYGYYEQHPDAIGRRLEIGSSQYVIVGVAPKGFTGVELARVDVWIPLTAELFADNGDYYMRDRGSMIIQTVARLRDDVQISAATAEASTIYQAHQDSTLVSRTPAPHVVLASIVPGRDPGPHSSTTVALWLLGVACVVLLIACANVATLLLTRALRRGHEIAVRLSLGVSRARLMMQLVVESLVLVALGAIGAFAVARAAHGFIYAVLLRGVAPDTGESSWHVVALMTAIGLGTAVVTALAPALHAISIDLSDALKSGNRTATSRRSALRSFFAVAQVALSVLLLVGAGLFVRSLQNIRAVPLGLDIDRLVLARMPFVNSPSPAPPTGQSAPSPMARTAPFWQEAARRVLALPGVESATMTVGIPFRSSMAIGLRVPGHEPLPQFTSGGPYANGVGPSYFKTLGTSVLRGRAFTDADGPKGQRVAIVNETMAKSIWGAKTPIGACIKVGGDSVPCSTIVGVVENIHRSTVLEGPQAQYYVPLAQWPAESWVPAMIVRTRGTDVQRAVPDVRRALQSVMPDAPFPLVDPFADFLDPQLASWRLGAQMFTLFGSLAFLVAVIGLHGLLSFSVTQRRHEFGIRAALGARGAELVGLVARDGARIMVLGVLLGLVLAASLASRIAPLLYQVKPHDVAVYAMVGILAGVIAFTASLIPARAAATADPIDALRVE